MKVTARPINALWLLGAAALAVGLVARSAHLGQPNAPVFDEAVFVKAANGYLHGRFEYQDHPPVGMWLIALGSGLFGDTGFGWRIMPYLGGLAVVGLLAAMAYACFGSRLAAGLASIFALTDGLFIVYGRMAFLDIFLLDGVLLAYLLALTAKDGRRFATAGVALGLAVAVKYNAAFLFPAIAYLAYRQGRVRWLPAYLAAALAAYVAVLAAAQALTGSIHPWADAWHWQWASLDIHTHQQPANLMNQPWYAWPLAFRPLYLDAGRLPDGLTMQVTAAFPNPLLAWVAFAAWAGTLAIVLTGSLPERLGPKRRTAITSLALAYAGLWTGWAFVGRPAYLYHYLTAYAFAILLLAGACSCFWKRYPWAVTLAVAAIVGCGWFFAPFWYGKPLSIPAGERRLWLPSWSQGM